MRRMLPHTRIRVRIDCTCHDPTVFGHLTCARRETQPNPNPPRPPDSLHSSTISFSDLQDLSITCGIISAEMVTLNEVSRETAQQMEELGAMIDYLERHQRPPRHG